MKREKEKEVVYLLNQGCSPDYIQKIFKKKGIIVSKNEIFLIAKKYKLKINNNMNKTEYMRNQINQKLQDTSYIEKIKNFILLFFIVILLIVILLGFFQGIKVALITFGVLIVLITCLCLISYFKFYKK